jgi:acyl-coenzyme A thioesterase PaaI-like protein
MAADRTNRGGVTVELATAYCGSLKQGQKVYFHVSIDKIGKNLGFSSCKVYSESNEILVNGHHTKFFANAKM